MRTAMVIPTIRPDSLREFRKQWQGADFDDIIVIYDGPRSECPLEWPEAQTYCWDDYESVYGEDQWIFSRRDSACRCFGFLRAVARGADVVLTLDDDCLPHEPGSAAGFAQSHLRRLAGAPRWVSSVPGLNVRGLPSEGGELDVGGPPVLVNVGLWSGVPDVSASETLAIGERGEAARRVLTRFVPPPGTQVMSGHQLFPLSGMNIAFRKEALSALYFPLMGERSPFARFDDIWGGLLLQRISTCTGDVITMGEPWVRHARASNVQENLRKERPGAAVNEDYWRVISELAVEGESLTEATLSAASGLAACGEPYLAEWGRALAIWVTLAEQARKAGDELHSGRVGAADSEAGECTA